jgi:hypothetical protein
MAKVPNPKDYPSNRKKDDKKIEPVVKNQVKTKEKSIARKFQETFRLSDLSEIKGYIYEDLVIPGFKKAIRGIVDIILDGEIRSSGKPSNGYRINYNRISANGKREDPEPKKKKRDFRDLIFETRADAEEVLSSLAELIDVYGQASIADLYSCCDITAEFTEFRYGWTNIAGASVSRVRDGYVLNLPKAEVLD